MNQFHEYYTATWGGKTQKNVCYQCRSNKRTSYENNKTLLPPPPPRSSGVSITISAAVTQKQIDPIVTASSDHLLCPFDCASALGSGPCVCLLLVKHSADSTALHIVNAQWMRATLLLPPSTPALSERANICQQRHPGVLLKLLSSAQR